MLRGQRTRRTTHHRRPCSFLIDSAAFNIVTMSVSARAVDVLANRQVIQIGDGGGGGGVRWSIKGINQAWSSYFQCSERLHNTPFEAENSD